ncbi:hypothetical protein I5I01_gp62 [Mycobacterium phage MooMoo]|uniref:Uncharacterized protein n=1 Tax=Mycobacterium phage MooMoo TaxID=2108127 RepID=A0A2P1JR98_9CAUD|nr:hypothetical protein I5I01_gp62 [Mycobacterium phage MooMoo]AVO21667.1 hypothetical protein SEA_MOOMOO_62 [Mycobacterium phage MooMoo]
MSDPEELTELRNLLEQGADLIQDQIDRHSDRQQYTAMAVAMARKEGFIEAQEIVRQWVEERLQ